MVIGDVIGIGGDASSSKSTAGGEDGGAVVRARFGAMVGAGSGRIAGSGDMARVRARKREIGPGLGTRAGQ